MAVTRTQRPHAGVAGVAFLTAEHPGTPGEKKLQETQYTLADGEDSVGSQVPIPHLFLVASQAIDPATGRPVPGPTTIGLWVPSAQESQAVGLLSAAGFTLD